MHLLIFGIIVHPCIQTLCLLISMCSFVSITTDVLYITQLYVSGFFLHSLHNFFILKLTKSLLPKNIFFCCICYLFSLLASSIKIIPVPIYLFKNYFFFWNLTLCLCKIILSQFNLRLFKHHLKHLKKLENIIQIPDFFILDFYFQLTFCIKFIINSHRLKIKISIWI